MSASVVVFHGGALGDWVMVWPWLRALVGAGERVVAVCEGEKGRCAERVIGGRTRGTGASGEAGGSIRSVGEDAGTALWRGASGLREDDVGELMRRIGRAKRVVSFTADPIGPGAGAMWWDAAERVWGEAARDRTFVGAPGSASRAREWNAARVERLGGVERRGRRREGAPGAEAVRVVMHVGAGAREKMWNMANWAAAAAALRCGWKSVDGAGIAEVRLIAGEVERERLSGAERSEFERAGGVFIDDLDGLREGLERGEIFVGSDSGPGHLAAQMGLGVVSVFGPTDERLWRPIGARGPVDARNARSGLDRAESAVPEKVAGGANDETVAGDAEDAEDAEDARKVVVEVSEGLACEAGRGGKGGEGEEGGEGRGGMTRVLASRAARGPIGSRQDRATHEVSVDRVVACVRTLATLLASIG